ncbi:MAG: HAD family phosphatase, partial [Bacteroidota bacterium]
MNLSTIRNIIFDLGGVIIDLDIPATLTGLALANRNTESQQLSLDEEGVLLDYEKGLISSEAFRMGVRRAMANPTL